MNSVIFVQLLSLMGCITSAPEEESGDTSAEPDSGGRDSAGEDTGGDDSGGETGDSGDTGELGQPLSFTELATGDCWSGCADMLDELATSCPDPWDCCDDVTVTLAFTQAELEDAFANELPAEPVPTLSSDVALLSFSTRCPQSGLELAVSDVFADGSTLNVSEDLHYPTAASDTISRPYNVVVVPIGTWESALATVTRDW